MVVLVVQFFPYKRHEKDTKKTRKPKMRVLSIMLAAGKRLANTAISLRPGGPSKDASANSKVQSRRKAEAGSVGGASTQQALDLLDIKEAQAGTPDIPY